ncbi:MAG: hypothetical protein PHO30_08635, partial [Candidatus Omnitrophica bacterium]|nr:hypothetical protein [Candidatus Omnitrophota bacterium]
SRSLAQARGIRAKFSVFAQRMRLWKKFRETKAIETGFALFAGLTRNDVEAQAKVLTLNPAALRIIEELKAISKSSGVNVAIISRSMQEMIQAFLARPEIQAELRQHGITVCAVAANESHFDRNVMRGLKPGAAGISLATKRNYIGQFYLYVTDKKERDLQGAHRTVFIEDFSLPEPGASAQNQLYKLYREPQLTFEGTSGMRGSAEAVITASPYLAAAFAEVLKKQHRDLNQKIIYVGYDSRESSPLIAQTAAAVFASYGLIVHFISVPTQSPVLANLLGLEKHNPDLVGGVMITGSHNPTPDNGFCPRQPDGAVMIEGMSDVYREFMRLYRTRDIAVPSGEFERYYAGHKIRAVNDAGDTYVNRVLKENPLLTRIMSRMKTMGIDPGALTIMYDPLKGSGAYIMPRVLSEFGFGVKVIDENGTIIRDPLDYAPVIRRIDRVPHPTRKMEESWENVVRNNGAPVDLILSNDGDADRFAVVEGEFIDWNELFVLLIDYLGQAGLLDGYTHIVSTYTTSDALTRIAQKYGLDVERVPVGFKHVSRKIGELRRQGYKVLAGFEGNGGMVLCNGTVGIDKDGVLANLIFSCIAAECKYYAMTLRGRIREAQRNADMGLDFGYMQELQVPRSGTGITYIRNLRKIRKDDEFLGRTVSRVVVSNPEALPELREVKIVFNNGSWLIMRPSGTSLDRARIYAEAETTGSRDVLILDILRDYCEATGNFSFERILRYLQEWLLTDFTPEQAGRIVHAVRQGGWDQARDLLVESRHAQVMRNRDEMVVDSLERLFAQRGGEAVAEHLLDLRRHSLSGYEQIRALLANTYSSPVFAHMARLFVATIDSADLYGINISEMSFQGVCNAVAGQIFNDIISVRAVRGPTRLLLENERTAQKMQRMLYTLLASNDYLIFSDPHATYRSVAELLASFPTAIPVVIGDVTYRGNRLFELQDLLEKNQAKLIFGEKEFWTIGGCLGNPFLTALSIASELRYNNFDMLNKLGIDFNVLMDFTDAEPKYTSKNIADF